MKEKRPIVSKDLPQRLKQLRESKGWSQGQLAKKIGGEPQRVSKYERAIVFPTVDMMIKLADAFGVSLDYLIRGEFEIELKNLSNRELVKRFDQVAQLPEKEQETLLHVMDSFIKNHRIETAIQRS
ncbi:helix-turn-helix domain-containing protein [Deltaproteobacteria bacterium TL4]